MDKAKGKTKVSNLQERVVLSFSLSHPAHGIDPEILLRLNIELK